MTWCFISLLYTIHQSVVITINYFQGCINDLIETVTVGFFTFQWFCESKHYNKD